MTTRKFKVGDKVRMVPTFGYCKEAKEDAKYICTVVKVFDMHCWIKLPDGYRRNPKSEFDWFVCVEELVLVMGQLMLFEDLGID